MILMFQTAVLNIYYIFYYRNEFFWNILSLAKIFSISQKKRPTTGSLSTKDDLQVANVVVTPHCVLKNLRCKLKVRIVSPEREICINQVHRTRSLRYKTGRLNTEINKKKAAKDWFRIRPHKFANTSPEPR